MTDAKAARGRFRRQVEARVPLSQQPFMTPRRPALEFPRPFPLKAIGREGEGFDAFVLEAVRRHVPDVDSAAVTRRPSGAGNYTAVTVTFTAQSREQLDALYRELSASERVLILL